MTRIPEDHEAARTLQREFERLGREQQGRIPDRPRGGKRLRGVLATAAAVLAAAAVAAATTTILRDDERAPSDPRPLPPELDPTPADRRLSPVRVADPAGGPPWGARLYTNRLGQPCIHLGRVSRERLGTVRGERFVPFPRSAPGECATREGQHLVVSWRRAADPQPGRSLLYGRADRAVIRVALERGDRTREIPIAADGVFLDVQSGLEAFDGTELVTVVGGKTRRARLLP